MAIDHCLTSQEIREWVKSGKISGTELDESRIQPSSYEPVLSDIAFILDDREGLLRPIGREPISRTLARIPNRRRRKVDISGGFELKTEFSYLIPLEERIRLKGTELVKSSPKSSMGRVFANIRLLTDASPCFDEAESNPEYTLDSELWLLVQPKPFNLIAYSGLTLNQLRFFTGPPARLSPDEIKTFLQKQDILYQRIDDELIPIEHPNVTSDGLRINLNLSGKETHGVVGLVARRNPDPVDLKKVGTHLAEDYFEPIIGSDSVCIAPREHYLFASAEVLCIPANINIELASHSHVGFNGPLHFAGFIDNGFCGDLVFEVISEESGPMILRDGMPLSQLILFRTGEPDKTYGSDTGAHYQGQLGPRTSKFFTSFDYPRAARDYSKLDRNVLVQERRILDSIRRTSLGGFEAVTTDQEKSLISRIQEGFIFHSRYDVDDLTVIDPIVSQPIPYILIFGSDRTVFHYVRAQNIEDYGDARLFGRHSIGIGGHINQTDIDLSNPNENYVRLCLGREMGEEVAFQGRHSDPVFVGTLLADAKLVDKAHFGLVYCVHIDEGISPAETSIISGQMQPIDDLMDNLDYSRRFETWSKLLMPFLGMLYDYSLR